MKYFAMIDGERRGPYTLEELGTAGVLPDTYVWCKGMDNWQKAEEVADICRYYRQRLYNISHTPTLPAVQQPLTQPTAQPEVADGVGPRTPREINRLGMAYDEMPEEHVDWLHTKPSDMLTPAVIATIFFFFPTGLAAFFSARKSRALWEESQITEDHAQAEQLARSAHDSSRYAKMLTGISFFLGMMVYATLISAFL